MAEETSGTHADNDTRPLTALDLERVMWMVEGITLVVRDRPGLSLPRNFLPWAEEFAMKVVALLPPEELEGAIFRSVVRLDSLLESLQRTARGTFMALNPPVDRQPADEEGEGGA